MDDNQNQIPVEVIKTPPPVNSYFKTLSAVLGVFVLVAGLGIAVKLSQQKQETRTKASADMVDLSLSADKTQVEPSQNINISVGMVTHNYKVNAMELNIKYDDTKFDFISFTKTDALPVVLTSATPVNGLISYNLGVSPGGSAAVDSIIANLVLKAKAGVFGGGLVQVDVSTKVAGVDASGNPVPTNLLGDKGETVISINQIMASPTPLSSPTPTPTPIGTSKIGDANGDGKVDGTDYTIWVNHYGQTTGNKALDGDFNEDGRVDGIDYSIWLLNYL